MNNNIDRITRGVAENCREIISVASEDPSARGELLKGGGSNGGALTKVLMTRPLNKIRISENALATCLENDVKPFDYFILSPSQLSKKHKNFFKSNKKTVEDCHEIGHFITGDHNPPNKELIRQMVELHQNNPNADIKEWIELLNQQSLDLITVEENNELNKKGLNSVGTRETRDELCSPKIEFTDLWLTPYEVISKFFEVSQLNKEECMDPCASDGRWLDGKGLSIDIMPMCKDVIKKDFLSFNKTELPQNIKTIVGNLPFSLLDEFVEKSFELVDDCYFLVNGDTIFKHFPNNIEHIYFFSGLEGEQKDNRSRCEFDVPFLIKSALWCCIVHITKKKQPKWIIEKNISNQEKRDGYHIALGKNVFIKSEKLVDENERITRISVEKGKIDYKGGKKLKIQEGEVLDLKNIKNLNAEDED